MNTPTTNATLITTSTSRSKYYNQTIAKIQAQTYYDLGKQLYEIISFQMKLGDRSTETSYKFWPAFINISFTCEIYLKLLYEKEHKEIIKGHKLFTDLYNKLSEGTQKLISDRTIENIKIRTSSSYTQENFFLI